MEGLGLIALAAGYWLNALIVGLILALLLAERKQKNAENTISDCPAPCSKEPGNKARPSPEATDHAQRQNSIIQYGLFGVKPNEKKKAKRRG
jgi:hypothetical protein